MWYVVVLDVYLFVDEPGVKRSPALLHVPTVDCIGYCIGLKRSQEKPSGLSYIIGCEIGSSLHRCHIDLAWNGWPVLCLTCRRQRKMTKMDPGVFWQLSWNFFLCEQVTPITPSGCSVVKTQPWNLRLSAFVSSDLLSCGFLAGLSGRTSLDTQCLWREICWTGAAGLVFACLKWARFSSSSRHWQIDMGPCTHLNGPENGTAWQPNKPCDSQPTSEHHRPPYIYCNID